MMHCTMDDVLALAAGEGSAWARQHVAGCAACRAELEALYQRVARLKALPARRPARDRWPAVRDAVLDERRRRRERDRKSTRLNSSHQIISYAVVCLYKRNSRDYIIVNTHQQTSSSTAY